MQRPQDQYGFKLSNITVAKPSLNDEPRYHEPQSCVAEGSEDFSNAKHCWKALEVIQNWRGVALPVFGEFGLLDCFNSLDRHAASRLAMTNGGVIAQGTWYNIALS